MAKSARPLAARRALIKRNTPLPLGANNHSTPLDASRTRA